MQISPSRRLHGTSARLKRGERGRGSWGSFAWVFEPRSRRYKLVNESSAQCVEIVTGEDKGWKCRRRLLLAAAAAPVVLRVGLAVRPAARLRFAPALRPRGRRTRRSCAAAAPHSPSFGFPIASSRRAARRGAPVLEPASPRRGPVLEGLSSARRRAPVVLKARPLRRPIFEAAAARRSSRITKASARRGTVLETTPTGRSIISKAAPASITEAAPSGTLITKAAAARVAEAAAARISVAKSTASGPIVATETAARRRPVVGGPRAAAAPVARTVRRLAPLALLRVGRLGLGRAFGAQAFSFSTMARNLFFSPLFIGGALSFFRGAALGHFALVLAFLLGA